MSQTGRYSRVSRRIWNDPKVRKLSGPQPCGKFLFVWLLTIPELSCIPGLFQAREAGLAEAIGWSLKGFRESFAELYRERLAVADWGVGLVWIPNSIAHNEPANPKVIKHWAATWAELPECELKAEARAVLLGYCEQRVESFVEAFRSACPYDYLNDIENHITNDMANQKQEQEQKQEQYIEGKPSRKRGVKTNPPDDFVPSEANRKAAVEFGKDVDAEWRRCANWHKSHGKQMVDWQATLHNWLEPKAWEKEKQGTLPIGHTPIDGKSIGLPGCE